MENGQSRARRYSTIKNRTFFLQFLLSAVVLIFLQFSGISGWIKLAASGLSAEPFAATAVYAVLFGVIFYAAGAPLGFYKGYVLEHRFGLSNQNLISWLKDESKKAIIALIIFLLFTEFLYLFLRKFPYKWWILMAGTWVIFGIIFANLVPVLIIPLFFKYKELQDEGLKARLIRLAKSCGINLLNVFKLDLSAKTRKANAALVGIGNTRRILLGDTLLNGYTEEEIEMVLAHEMAHHKFKHMWKSITFGGLCTIIGFYLLNTLLMSLVRFLGLESTYDIELFPSIILILIIFSMLIMPIQNWYSRSMEKQADLFAIKLTGLPEVFVSCMNKLARQNLANTSPSKFIEIMIYDHPPISKRIKMAHEIIKRGEK